MRPKGEGAGIGGVVGIRASNSGSAGFGAEAGVIGSWGRGTGWKQEKQLEGYGRDPVSGQ